MYIPGNYTGSNLELYLQQELLKISQAIQPLVDGAMEKRHVAPVKPRNGLYYADGTNWDPGSGPGVYRFDEVTETFEVLFSGHTEGTWVPEYHAATDFSSITYGSATDAYYYRIGRLVYIKGFINTDDVTLGGGTGQVEISGLPYDTANNDILNSFAGIIIGYTVAWPAASAPLSALLARNADNFFLYRRSAADEDPGAILAQTHFTTGTVSGQHQIRFAGVYLTDEEF